MVSRLILHQVFKLRLLKVMRKQVVIVPVPTRDQKLAVGLAAEGGVEVSSFIFPLCPGAFVDKKGVSSDEIYISLECELVFKSEARLAMIYLCIHIYVPFTSSGRTSGRGRGRGRARGASGALAAAAAAMAGAAAGSAAAYAAYGFSYQASTSTPPSNRVSPVAFGAGPSPSSSGGYKQQNTGVVLPPHVSRYEGSASTSPNGEQINVTRVETGSSKKHKSNKGSTT